MKRNPTLKMNRPRAQTRGQKPKTTGSNSIQGKSDFTPYRQQVKPAALTQKIRSASSGHSVSEKVSFEPDTISQFRNAILPFGLVPPLDILPGKIHRFPGIGKPPGNTSGWCVLFADFQGGSFGDWSTCFEQVWHSKRKTPYSASEQMAFRRPQAAARRKNRLDSQKSQSRAADRARTIWNEASACTHPHSYLCSKGIKPNGARMHRGMLVLPVTDFQGNLTSLQFIKPDGAKVLLKHGRKRGCFISVAGDESECPRIIICEGWATGCSVAEDEPGALVLSAIDAGNMETVAVAARRRWPQHQLVIAGDDDRLTKGNPGATAAYSAATAADATVTLPDWPDDAPEHLTDFNDLACWLAGGSR